jgi:GNAT superfamily N-acetyltransferase
MRSYGRGVPEVRLAPMSDEEHAEFRERSEVSYAAEIAASRAVPLPEARRQAAEDHERLLPEGVRTPDHYLWTAYEGDEPVGDIWLHVETKPDGLHASGYGFEVRQELRRRGYGRAIAAAAEQRCREMNVVSIGLTVFGPNKAAQRLYEDLGFEVTVLQMRKHLSTA